MKLRLLSSLVAFLGVAAFTACATSTNGMAVDTSDGGADSGAILDEANDDPATQPPHSLGSIVLGESHSTSSGSGTRSTPVVTATFVPDAIAAKSCKKSIAGGCEITATPRCTDSTTTSSGCLSNEVCTLDDSCESVCKKVVTVTCDEDCAADEVCTGKTATSTTGTCVKVPTFDAGPLAFSGTTTPITLFPPYAFQSDGQGAPFLGGSQLRVQAQGAIEVGFEAFDETFTSTTFLQTTPSLSKIPRSTIYGSGAIPVGWLPSTASTTDSVIVTVSGSGGTATCKVKDVDAQFSIPRSVVKAAQGPNADASAPVSIAVSRQRKELHKDKKAKGELARGTVQPEGWLELVTMSTETASFQGCTTAGQALCDDTCTSLASDHENCGSCGNACAANQVCSSGTCTINSAACSSCKSTAQSGVCSSYYSTCSAVNDCYYLASCVRTCTTASCVSTCNSNYPAGATAFAGLKSCWDAQCYSSCGF